MRRLGQPVFPVIGATVMIAPIGLRLTAQPQVGHLCFAPDVSPDDPVYDRVCRFVPVSGQALARAAFAAPAESRETPTCARSRGP